MGTSCTFGVPFAAQKCLLLDGPKAWSDLQNGHLIALYLTITCVTFFWTILSSVLVLSLMLTMLLDIRIKNISPDCFTQAMIDGSRIFPRSVLQDNTIIVSYGLANFERNSWSTQRCHKIWELRDELATMADYDKFLESFKDNCPGASDGRSVWIIDCEKLDFSDQDKNLEIHAGRNSRIMKSIFGIQGLPRAA